MFTDPKFKCLILYSSVPSVSQCFKYIIYYVPSTVLRIMY